MITAKILITQGNNAQPLARIDPAKLLNRHRTLIPHALQPRGRGPSAHHRSTPCPAPGYIQAIVSAKRISFHPPWAVSGSSCDLSPDLEDASGPAPSPARTRLFRGTPGDQVSPLGEGIPFFRVALTRSAAKPNSVSRQKRKNPPHLKIPTSLHSFTLPLRPDAAILPTTLVRGTTSGTLFFRRGVRSAPPRRRPFDGDALCRLFHPTAGD